MANPTHFTGSGDTQTIGAGIRFLSNVTASDTSIQVDISFSEDIWINKGTIGFKNAPFGAYINADVIHPTEGKISCFANKIPLLGSHYIEIKPKYEALLKTGLTLRVTVYNSTGMDGQEPRGGAPMVPGC